MTERDGLASHHATEDGHSACRPDLCDEAARRAVGLVTSRRSGESQCALAEPERSTATVLRLRYRVDLLASGFSAVLCPHAWLAGGCPNVAELAGLEVS